MGLTSDSDACDGPAGAERGDATEADIATRKMCDKLLVLCRKQRGCPNRMRELSDESVKSGWTATRLEAKQDKGGPRGLERSEVVGLGLQEIKSTNGQKEAIAIVLFSSEEMANEISLIGYGMYSEDGGVFLLNAGNMWSWRGGRLLFSRQLQSERATFVTSA